MPPAARPSGARASPPNARFSSARTMAASHPTTPIAPSWELLDPAGSARDMSRTQPPSHTTPPGDSPHTPQSARRAGELQSPFATPTDDAMAMRAGCSDDQVLVDGIDRATAARLVGRSSGAAAAASGREPTPRRRDSAVWPSRRRRRLGRRPFSNRLFRCLGGNRITAAFDMDVTPFRRAAEASSLRPYLQSS